MLFWKKKNLDRLESTRELDRETPETTQFHGNTHNSMQQDSDSGTLDDIGIPPPPPSLSQQKKNKKLEKARIKKEKKEKKKKGFFKRPYSKGTLTDSSTMNDENQNLKPFTNNVHETVEAELPKDYDKKFEELDKELHILSTAKKNIHPEQRIIKYDKKIVDKLSSDAKKAVAKLEKEINRMNEKTENAINEIREFSKLNHKVSKDYKSTIEEKKELIKRYHEIYRGYHSTLDKQKENQRFVDDFKHYINPLKAKQDRLIRDSEKVLKDSIILHKQFDELLKVTKDVDARNDILASDIKKIGKYLVDISSGLKKNESEFSSINTDLEKMNGKLSDVNTLSKDSEKRISSLEKNNERIQKLEKKIEDLQKENSFLKKEVSRHDTKISILREKVHVKRK